MANKKLYTWVAASGIALASAGAWWFQHRTVPLADGAAAPARGPGTSDSGAGGRAGRRRRRGWAGECRGGPGPSVALQDDAQAVGSLRSRQSVTLRPEVSGRIAAIAFADGARVRQGQLLVQLDDVLQKAS